MAFVNPNVRACPHFRHRVESNCAWEPETPDHENAKLAVCDAINSLGMGSADVEVPVGKWIADVLWSDGKHRVAFEIQRANYTWAKFNEKFLGYAEQDVAVVYLFIGAQFYRRTESEDFRLKDIEHRLFLGQPERRDAPVWHGRRASVMEIYRLRRERLGAVIGGYLRRQQKGSGALLVREPIFYPSATKAGRPSIALAWEAGKAVTPLQEYLHAVHQTFLVQPGTIFWCGIWFSRLADAVWGHFFSALGMTYTYTPDAPNRPAKFEFKGRYHLVAWVSSGRRPHVPDTSHELRLADEPKLSRDFLFVGSVSDDETFDEAILACYTRDTATPKIDFGQYNQNYSGAISGLHDGGSPGGNMGSEIARQAFDLWKDGRALLSRGVGIPLGVPRFEGLNGFPRLRFS